MHTLHAAAFTGIDYLALVPRVVAHALTRPQSEEHEIRRIRIIHETDIRILIARTEDLRGGTRTLQGKLLCIDELRLFPGKRRKIGVSGCVYRTLAADNSASSVSHDHYNTCKLFPFKHYTLHKRTVPDLRTSLTGFATEPFALRLTIYACDFLHVCVNLGSKALPVAVAVVADKPFRHNTAHHIQVFGYDRLRPGARRRNRGRRAARSGTGNEHVAICKNRKRGSRNLHSAGSTA